MSRWYGSMVNRLMDGSKNPAPVVGMGVTECLWSDRHPYEIIDVKDERHIVVRRLDYKRIDNNGMSDCQDYEYSSNENNATERLFLTNKGQWRRRIGRNGIDNNAGWFLGYAEEYYDFSF